MIYNDKVKKVLLGGDYNPEQWSEDIWEEDMRLFALAGIDEVTINVFSWALLQPKEDVYDFTLLDKIMKLVNKHGLSVCLATSTAAHPAWMARKYKDVLRTEFNGMKRKFGSRHNSCPNSITYREYAQKLAKKLADRYKDWDNIVGWHISNEYGGECYCENCEKKFRIWLKNKYGTIKELNRAWNTAFWGHTFYDFDEIVVPNLLSEHFEENRTTFQGISLDYRRFNSDSLLECYLLEYDTIKEIIPDAFITTNLMGFYKTLDYQKWGEHLDFISWDNYPSNDDPFTRIAMNHDLMRGLKDGKPFVLMEQTPSVTNWLSYNALKRPGVMRLWSYQAMAHGADALLFFQMRRSIGACEKYHGAVIDHVGHENTRVFQEIKKMGEELKLLGSEILSSKIDAEIGLLVDWDNWWALEYSAGPSCDLKYLDEVFLYYNGLVKSHYAVDIIGTKNDFGKYKMIIAPILYMTKSGLDDKIRTFVKEGGTFITSFFSGIVDEHDLVITGGYPGKLRDILGIWVEEIDALPQNEENSFLYEEKVYPATLLCDIMHSEGAEIISRYCRDFYENTPVLTSNMFGTGKAYYVGTRSNQSFYSHFLNSRCEEIGIKPVLDVPDDIEVTLRKRGNERYLFLLNHGSKGQYVNLSDKYENLLTENRKLEKDIVYIEPKGVKVLKQRGVS